MNKFDYFFILIFSDKMQCNALRSPVMRHIRRFIKLIVLNPDIFKSYKNFFKKNSQRKKYK